MKEMKILFSILLLIITCAVAFLSLDSGYDFNEKLLCFIRLCVVIASSNIWQAQSANHPETDGEKASRQQLTIAQLQAEISRLRANMVRFRVGFYLYLLISVLVDTKFQPFVEVIQQIFGG